MTNNALIDIKPSTRKSARLEAKRQADKQLFEKNDQTFIKSSTGNTSKNLIDNCTSSNYQSACTLIPGRSKRGIGNEHGDIADNDEKDEDKDKSVCKRRKMCAHSSTKPSKIQKNCTKKELFENVCNLRDRVSELEAKIEKLEKQKKKIQKENETTQINLERSEKELENAQSMIGVKKRFNQVMKDEIRFMNENSRKTKRRYKRKIKKLVHKLELSINEQIRTTAEYDRLLVDNERMHKILCRHWYVWE